jgi:hypothetical protein
MPSPEAEFPDITPEQAKTAPEGIYIIYGEEYYVDGQGNAFKKKAE